MLVGRGEETQALLAMVKTPTPGQVHVIRIRGEIGVGKSAFLATAIGHLGALNCAPTAGAEEPAQAGSPDPPDEQLSTPRVIFARGVVSPDEPALAAFRICIEEFYGTRLENLLAEQTPEVIGARMAEGLGTAHVILALDDAHKLRDDAIRFLSSVLAHSYRFPLTLILAHPSTKSPKRLLTAASSYGARISELQLGLLEDRAIDEIVAELPVPQRSAVITTARGNSLIAFTLLGYFRRYPEESEVNSVLRRAKADGDGGVWSGKSAALADLSSPAWATLGALTVLGEAAPSNQLRAVAVLSPDELADGLEELRTRGLLTRGRRRGLHPVVRLCVYQEFAGDELGAIQRRAAALPGLETAQRADILASLAPDLTDAEVAILERKAEQTLTKRPATVSSWLTALDPAQLSPAGVTTLARALVLEGHAADAVELLQQESLDTSSVQARIVLADAMRASGRVAETRHFLAASEDKLEPELLREYVDIVALLDGAVPEKLLSRLERMPGEVNRAVAGVYRAMDLLGEGRIAQAEVMFKRASLWLIRAEENQLGAVLHSVACAVWVAYLLDEYADGVTLAWRGMSQARKRGQADVLSNLNIGLSYCYAAQGRLDDAETYADEGIAAARQYGPADAEAMAQANLVMIAQARGDRAKVADQVEILACTPLPEFEWWRRAVLTTQTRVWALLGKTRIFPEVLGEPHDVMSVMRHGDAALAAAAGGDIGAARSYLAEGRAIAKKQRSARHEAQIDIAQAEITLAGGEALVAANLFRKALQQFEECGMKLLMFRARGGLARAEAAMAKTTRSLAELTNREREIASAVAQGLTNQQIANRFVLSRRTVENHVGNILRKLDAGSRREVEEIVAGA